MTGGRDINAALPGWTPPPVPPDDLVLAGRHVRIERLSPDHADGLQHALGADRPLWTHMLHGPFDDAAAYRAWIEREGTGTDPFFVTIFDRSSGKIVGTAAYLAIKPVMGTIEVGAIMFSRALQRTTAATEAMYLMMRWAFQAGYRRYEWKCDATNLPSRRAAQRLGFSYEGIFRQHMIVRGRNRDTAWFSVIDRDWPALRDALETWLADGNFEGDGRQKRRLGDLTAPVLAARDPPL